MITSELSIIWNINYDRWPLVTLVTAPPWSPLLLSALGHSILGWLLTTNNKKALSDTLWSSEVDIMLALETHWLCWSGGQWLRTQWWHPELLCWEDFIIVEYLLTRRVSVRTRFASHLQQQSAAVSHLILQSKLITAYLGYNRHWRLDLSLLTTNTRALQARESGK